MEQIFFPSPPPVHPSTCCSSGGPPQSPRLRRASWTHLASCHSFRFSRDRLCLLGWCYSTGNVAEVRGQRGTIRFLLDPWFSPGAWVASQSDPLDSPVSPQLRVPGPLSQQASRSQVSYLWTARPHRPVGIPGSTHIWQELRPVLSAQTIPLTPL